MSKKVDIKIDGLNQRFIQVMEVLGHTGYSLSKELDTSEAVISNVRLGKHPPNVILIGRLINKYREVDAEWLLTGNGRMLRATGEAPSGTVPQVSAQVLEVKMDELLHLFRKSIEVQFERNLMVDESITVLERKMKDLKKVGSNLKKVHRSER